MLMSDGLVGAVGLNTVGPTSRPVKRLGFVISDGHRQPSEITYVRRLPSDIALFPTSYLRRLKAVGDKALPSEIIYFRRFIPYVRRLWPSDVSAFTVVYVPCRCMHAVMSVITVSASVITVSCSNILVYNLIPSF